MKKTFIKNAAIISVALSAFYLNNTKAGENQDDKKTIADVLDRVELTTSFIKGNKELPQVLYIVPWQEVKKVTKKPENMVLHSLYGNIFQPITSADLTDK
jgi:hypothetical protein